MRKKFTILLLLFLTVGRLVAETKYMKLIDEADKSIAADEYDKAISLLLDALREEPDNSGNVMLLSNVGMLNYYTGRDSLALHYLSAAHAMAPESVTILTNRAKVYSGMGEIGRALNDYNMVCELDSTRYEPFLNRSVIYLTVGDTVNAAQSLARVRNLIDTSKSIEASAALAWLYTQEGNNSQAAVEYGHLIELAPQAEFYASRALCYVAMDMLSEASGDIGAGLELDSGCADLYLARACLNKSAHFNDEALKDAQRAIDLGADRGRVKKMLGL